MAPLVAPAVVPLAPDVPVAADVRITGVVQGVGFRPFVHRLAVRHGLAGDVRNESGSVAAFVEGAPGAIGAFVEAVRREAPPLARIDAVTWQPADLRGMEEFRVLESRARPGERLPVSPDVATCEACGVELRDATNRRHGHPFITCTDCGPRYAVIESMPYDRERTTMRAFAMCPACEEEYRDPADRRYHSETNSCPECGPRLWLEIGGERPDGPDHLARGGGDGDDDGPAGLSRVAIDVAAAKLRRGEVVAVRSVGGFHLAVDATDAAAVSRLRGRKGRDEKPFAILVESLDAARRLAEIDDTEAALLESPERPIVLLRRRADAELAAGVSPGLATVGVMLPYAPHHGLLAAAVGRPLVFTSGNLSEEPLAAELDEGRDRLGPLADAFLMHDREIAARIDDSVARAVDGEAVLLRRARGYAPLPLPSPVETPLPLLAVGGHLKNTFALMQDERVYMSPHIGDLETLETLEHRDRSLARYRELFDIAPCAVAHDMHPGYVSTRRAQELGLSPAMAVQHHHAHVVAVAAEHGVVDPVLGIAYDGTGYGVDGRIWGAELLVSTPWRFRRVAHLRYAPLPGGDLAARHPWRAAAGLLSLMPGADPGHAFRDVDEPERRLVLAQIDKRVNAPEWSSMGRLFDAAAAILGLRSVSTYEGQAAMELESLAGDIDADPLLFPWTAEGSMRTMEPGPLLSGLAEGLAQGGDPAELAAAFHEAIAATTAALAGQICAEERLDSVALGGGVFQNARLLSSTRRRLAERGLRVLVPRLLGPNDGALSYGQAVVAAARLGAGTT